jgi:fumarylacetoacetase
MIDETHDPLLRSWVESANDPQSDFPIQNLPLGIVSQIVDGEPRTGVVVAIGDQALDLARCVDRGLLKFLTIEHEWFRFFALNPILSKGRPALNEIRRHVSTLLRHDNAARAEAAECLIPLATFQPRLPARIGDYTDFYASIHHATNVGSMFRPDNPLLPNYKWVPIGYHGRSSSIVPSGTVVRRPFGQTREGEAPPHFGPSKRLDYEMELGAFLCADNEQGEAIPLAAAEEHLAGLCIVNDWSARDLQTWEYQPLGPFLAKNFATSISPWLVTTDALEPFRVAAFARADEDPQPLPYLFGEEDQRRGGFEITVEVLITTRAMREKNMAPQRLSRGNFRDMYWTFGQMITHHASNGCNLRAGDLLASGTISGTTKESRGSMLELSWRGTEPIELPDGETRRFLEEGDEITMRAWCEKDGFARIGFGECRGIIA